MKQIVSVEQMRRSDAAEIAANTPSLELMRRAGEAVFRSYPWRGRVAIVCGVGNNAGDGYVLAMCLKKEGIPCRLLLIEEKFSADGRHYFDICQAMGIPWSIMKENEDFSKDTEIVDCIFGTGFHGNAEGRAKMAIDAINRAKKPTVSVDVNSGMNGDSGLGEPCIRSTLTVSIGSLKAGHFLGNAKDVIGKLTNADIGIPIQGETAYLAENTDFARFFKTRPQNSHKGSYGYVGILGGCAEYSGAAKLANLSCAALRSGCGVATLAVPKTISASVSPHLLESTLLPIPDDGEGHMQFDASSLDRLMSRNRALAVGMGWGRSEENEKILSYLLAHYEGTLILDADGLNTLAEIGSQSIREARCKVLLTPHVKEFERISGYSMTKILENPIGKATEYAKQYGVCLLLKGACTVVTDGEETYLSPRGCAGMATAGSGDVLSGILAGILGYNDLTPLSATAGAYLAGLAGEIAEKKINAISMLASDTVAAIPEAIGRLIP
jgi:NAD(P)H-hydrate epimerase